MKADVQSTEELDFATLSELRGDGEGPLCNTEFSTAEVPYAFMVTGAPMNPNPIMLTGVCHHCCSYENEQLLKIGHAQIKKIWTDAYPLPSSDGVH